jgi:hypothetical protein
LTVGLHRLPLIEQNTLDEWGTVLSIGIGFAGGGLIQNTLPSQFLRSLFTLMAAVAPAWS